MSRFQIDWSQKDERLKKYVAQGMGAKAIAPMLGVSDGAVQGRMRKLGLKRGQQD
jgi:hypothetical protein